MFRHVFAWLVVVVAVAGISGGLGLYKHNEFEVAQAAAEASPEPMEAVAIVRARKGEWSASTRAIGTVVALRQLEIRNELAGTIAEMGFTSGDIVEAGQLLVQLDVRQERASLAAAEADARLAKVTLDRRESLRNSPAFSAQELDKSREDFAAATARATSLGVGDREEADRGAVSRAHRHHQSATRRLSRRRHAHRHAAGRRRRRLCRLLSAAGQRRRRSGTDTTVTLSGPGHSGRLGSGQGRRRGRQRRRLKPRGAIPGRGEAASATGFVPACSSTSSR